jgi:single-stranded-DNA-specific exonuclease RecJ
MLDRRWIIDPRNIIEAGDPSSAAEKAEELLLRARNVAPEEVNSFFVPQVLPEVPEDPSLLAAAELIMSTAEDGGRIAVFGDYDCDGICATAIIYHFLVNYLEADAEYHIPDRFGEGYGITPEAVDRMCEQGVELIVTVDNGITAVAAAARAEALGITMVITDHHLPSGDLPGCAVIVDPHLEESEFGFRDECGAGVAYTLVRAIARELGISDRETEGYLMCAAIATVADSVPLKDKNRTYVRLGLEAMRRAIRRTGFGSGTSGEEESTAFGPGIRALLTAAGIYGDSNFTANDLSFKVIPKINAAGRLGSAENAIRVMLSDTDDEAAEAAQKLSDDNALRKNIEQEIFNDSLNPERMLTGPDDKLVVSLGETWHQGVLGIVASRLAEKFVRPAIVLTLQEDGEDPIYKGSGRSVEGIDIYDAMLSCSAFFERFGGHSRAAGLSIKRSNLRPFIDAFNKYYVDRGAAEAGNVQEYTADLMMHASMVDVAFADMINAFEPFGEGNRPPQIIVTGLTLVSAARIGADNAHLRLSFSATGPGGEILRIDGIAFRCGNLYETVRHMGRVSALCTPKRDGFRPDQLSLQVTDLHDFDLDVEKRRLCMYNKPYTTFESFAPDAEFMRAVYRGISKLPDEFTFNDLIGLRARLTGEGSYCSWYRLKCCIDIFTELKLLIRRSKTQFALDRSVAKTDLESSRTYRSLMTEAVTVPAAGTPEGSGDRP